MDTTLQMPDDPPASAANTNVPADATNTPPTQLGRPAQQAEAPAPERTNKDTSVRVLANEDAPTGTNNAPTDSAPATTFPLPVVPYPDDKDHADLLHRAEAAWKAGNMGAASSWKTYVRQGKHFLRWLEAQGQKLFSAPADSIVRFANARSENGQTRMLTDTALRMVLKAAANAGYQNLPVFDEVAKVARPTVSAEEKARRKQLRAAVMNTNAVNEVPKENGMNGTNGANNGGIDGIALGTPQPTQTPQPVQYAPPLPQAPQQQPTVVQVQVVPGGGGKRGGGNGANGGGPVALSANTNDRVTVFMRAYHGYGVAIGSQIRIGTYPLRDVLAKDGTVENYIERWIHPDYRLQARQHSVDHITYEYQRIDANGKPAGAMVECTLTVPPWNEGETSGTSLQRLAYHDEMRKLREELENIKNRSHEAIGSNPLDYRAQVIASELRASYEEVAKKMRWVEEDIRESERKLRQEQEEDRRKAREAADSAAREARSRELRDMESRAAATPQNTQPGGAPVPPSQAPSFGAPATPIGPLGGVGAGASTNAQGDRITELLGNVIERVMEQQAMRQLPPPPDWKPSTPPAPVEKPIDPLVSRVLDAAIAKLTAPAPEPPKPPEPKEDKGTALVIEMLRESNRELREEIREMRRAQTAVPQKSTLEQLRETIALVDEIRPPGGEVNLAEALTQVAPHFDKLGEGFAKVVMAWRAPRLVEAGEQPAGALPPAAQTQKPPPQVPGQVIEMLRVAARAPDSKDGDQEIINNVFGMIKVLAKTDGFQPVVDAIGQEFATCDSKPEIRSLVTRIFRLTNDKVLIADEAGTERVTVCLHRHYSLLFSTLFQGKTKSLSDAVAATGANGAAAPATSTSATSTIVTPPPATNGAPKNGAAAVNGLKPFEESTGNAPPYKPDPEEDAEPGEGGESEDEGESDEGEDDENESNEQETN